jgi:hypothetical protein
MTENTNYAGQANSLKARKPNWLPRPSSHIIEMPEVSVSEEDQFPKGTVLKFYQNLGVGKIKDVAGREIEFNLAALELVGPKSKTDYIKVGGKVGYDLSRVGKGLKVVKLKVY